MRKIFLMIMIVLVPGQVYAGEGVKDWGLGFGLGVEQYKDDYIEAASLRGDERIVVTEKKYETLPSAWLTLNWNVWGVKQNPVEKAAGSDVYDCKWGFFAGVKLIDSNSEAFSAFALGPQVTFLTNKKEITIGLGFVTHRTKEYASGIEEGKPLPAYYDDIVYEEGTENSGMLMMSVNLF